MTLLQAIETRVSRRKYIPLPLTTEFTEVLDTRIERYNRAAGLHMQLIVDNDSAFRSARKSYGLFSGVCNYIALVAPGALKHAKEKLGYYGELLVLHATSLGLGTCWVGGTFDRDNCRYKTEEGEALLCVIALGPVLAERSLKEKVIKKAMAHKSIPLESLYAADQTPPDWFMDGVRAAARAPSAVNRRPVRFAWIDETASAFVETYADSNPIDLGIAKAHFAVGAGRGHWGWGNSASFIRDDNDASPE